MNTKELRDILMSDSFTSMLNPAVLSLDEYLDSEPTFPSMKIINFDYSYQYGSHWVALYMTSTGAGEYFDSYGGLVKNIQIEKKLKGIRRITRNTTMLQGISTVCGQYCLIFLLMRARSYSFRDIISKLCFTDSSKERDYIVNQLINKMYFPSILSKRTVLFDKSIMKQRKKVGMIFDK